MLIISNSLNNPSFSLKQKTLLCVNMGYLSIKKLHQNIEMPKKKIKLSSLSKEDKLENRERLSKCILIEHINSKIKTFKIVAQKYRNRRK
jgi:hypothetical protein